MAVNKLIKFYILEPLPSLYFDDSNGMLSKSTHSIFESAFCNGTDYYSIDYEKKKLFFDIKEFDESHIFGTCSIVETIQANAFMQRRNIQTNETKPFTTVNGDEQLEAYTFFYIDFSTNRMAAIVNKKISKLHTVISYFIYEKSGKLASIEIAPEKNDNPRKLAESLIDWSHIQLEFFTNDSTKNIRPIKKALGSDFEIEKYKVDMKIKNGKKTMVDSLFSLKERVSEEGISKLNIIGKNELGVDETINLIETLNSKAVPFNLSDDSSLNIEYIKKNLKEFLGYRLG